MGLQLRRGTSSTLTSITPAQGELVYTTDTKRVFVGDGSTAGGNPVSPVTTVAGRTGAVSLSTDDIAEGINLGKQYFTATRASDAVGAMLAAGTLNGLTVSYNSTTHAITISAVGSISSGTTNSLAYWASNGTTLSPSSSLIWDEVGNALTNINGVVTIVANNGNRNTLIQSTYNNIAYGQNYTGFHRARGTNITPLPVQGNDGIHAINFNGWDGTQFSPAVSIAASVSPGTVSTGIVQGTFLVSTTNASGINDIRLRIDGNGVTSLGPINAGDTGTGTLRITQTVSSTTGSTTRMFNYYSDASGVLHSFYKARGTFSAPTTVLTNDQIAFIRASGYDGTANRVAGSIQIFADGVVGTGYVPGRIEFYTANAAGTSVLAARIDSTQTFTHSGNVVVNGSLTINGTTVTTNATTVNVEDKLMKLGYLTSSTVSTTGMISSVSGTGPWTATISGMTSTVDLIVGSPITATGTGTTGTLALTATTHATASATAASLSGTTLTLGGTVSGSFAIGMSISGTGINPGTYITAGSGTTWTINTTPTANTFTSGSITGTSNIITVASTSALQIGTVITSPSVFGGLQSVTNYYVNNIVSSTKFSVSSTAFGTTDFTLTSATGTVSLTYSNGTLGTGGTYTVASIISGSSITFTATGGTTPLVGPVTTIATSGATDATANGGGVQVYGATNKTFTWASLTGAWTSSENINLVSTKAYEINGASVLNATTLGAGVTGSSLTGVGTITSGIWNSNLIVGQYGGTGVNNGTNTITIGGNISTAGSFTLSGAFTTTLSVTANTSLTLPTSGTLVSTLTTSLTNLTAVGTLSNLTVASSGVITGDFDNSTFANRTVFKTVTTNASTGIYAVPNGTNTAASWQALNNSTPTNASKILIATNGSTDVQLVSGINGTGTYLPLTIWNNGSGQVKLDTSGNFTVYGLGGLGYSTGSGGSATQGTSRTTAVVLSKTNGAITLFTAAGSTTPTTFTVTNTTVAATDTVIVNVKSSTNVYLTFVTAVASGSFNITFYTTGGVTSDAPVFNFSVIKAVTA
jgi:hypothetical protein